MRDLHSCRGTDRHGVDDGTAAVIFGGERIHCGSFFLNRIRIRTEVDDAGTNVAGNLQTVDDIHVGIATAAVSAGIHQLFCGEVVGRRRPYSGCPLALYRRHRALA